METFKETIYVFNEIYPTWTADQDITRLYNNYLSGIRTLNMRGKVGVKHISYHTCLRGKDKNASYMRANMKVTDGIDYTERSIRNITNRINKYKEKAMVFRKVEPKVEPVKEKKEIVIEVDAKVEVVKDYKGVGDDIVTNPTIG